MSSSRSTFLSGWVIVFLVGECADAASSQDKNSAVIISHESFWSREIVGVKQLLRLFLDSKLATEGSAEGQPKGVPSSGIERRILREIVRVYFFRRKKIFC